MNTRACIMITVTTSSLLIGKYSMSHATVLEFSARGELTVSEKQKQIVVEPIVRSLSANSEIKTLTREIALQYSGSVGVRKAGLDALTFVEVFEALIQRESAFSPDAVSEKGAMGLGQLMPDTASDMGVENPFDPEANLNGSAKFFTNLLNEFSSLELALAAYNAGPQRVRDHKGVPPFKETKDYIAWISSKAGIENPELINAALPKDADNTEQPLTGEKSVWEF